MKIKYDKEADVVYIQLSDNKVFESKQEKQSVVIDYDSNGSVVGIEILQASSHIDKVAGISYELA